MVNSWLCLGFGSVLFPFPEEQKQIQNHYFDNLVQNYSEFDLEVAEETQCQTDDQDHELDYMSQEQEYQGCWKYLVVVLESLEDFHDHNY